MTARRPKRILVVEPEPSIAQILEEFFIGQGYEVVICHSAESAIFAADEKRPDIVVLEVAMAEHNGVAFLHEFHSYSDWINIPVIIHTHVPGVGNHQKDLQLLGVVDKLYKPSTSLRQLQRCVEAHI